MPVFQVNSRLHATPAQQNLGTSFKTIVGLAAATASLRRGYCMEIAFGADGAPNATDCQIVYDVARQTAAGTGVTSVPTPRDPNDQAAVTVALINCTVEPTITAASTLWAKALNQRASQIWYAKDKLNALIWPATNLNGIAVRALSPTYAAPVLVETVHEE